MNWDPSGGEPARAARRPQASARCNTNEPRRRSVGDGASIDGRRRSNDLAGGGRRQISLRRDLGPLLIRPRRRSSVWRPPQRHGRAAARAPIGRGNAPPGRSRRKGSARRPGSRARCSCPAVRLGWIARIRASVPRTIIRNCFDEPPPAAQSALATVGDRPASQTRAAPTRVRFVASIIARWRTTSADENSHRQGPPLRSRTWRDPCGIAESALSARVWMSLEARP